MKDDANSRPVPIRVFRVGSVEAVLWMPQSTSKLTREGEAYSVSLHRILGSALQALETTTLMSIDDVTNAIEALEQAMGFLQLQLMCDGQADAEGLFDPAIELLQGEEL